MTDDAAPAKILIVEDEALIAREIQHRLTNMGWEVVGIAMGREAIDLAVDKEPDLLLSDIHLKHGLSGIDLAKEIKELIDIPVVFLTAYSDDDTVSKAKAVTPFGYIIKPVENRDLQITIEMALYKFRVEKELREKQQLLETALACIGNAGNALVFLNAQGEVSNANEDARRLFGQKITTGSPWHQVLNISEHSSISGIVDSAFAEKGVVKIPPFITAADTDASKLVDGIIGPMDEGVVLILRDLGEVENPVEMGTPSDVMSMLGADHLSPSESAFCQLLLSPDNVRSVEISDVVTAVRGYLDASLRSTDLASVFADSMVSVSMPYTRVDEGERIAGMLLNQLRQFRFEGRPVEFSAGLAFSTAGDYEPIELFRRATAALDMARKSGGGSLSVWSEEKNLDPRELRGGGEYRHVVLLWNVMNALANAESAEAVRGEFCQHLQATFFSRYAAIFSEQGSGVQMDVAHLEGKGHTEDVRDLAISEEEFVVLDEVIKGGNPGKLEDSLVLPLGDSRALLLAGNVAEEDRGFLETLCTYYRSSLSRFEALVEEPDEPDLQSSRPLIYKSHEMKEVLDTANLAAPTDATVLLTGESGTGKELIARFIHEHGPRRETPLVVVDCGAVAPSLIESELFGHVKGAFTGATSNFNGKLKDANGGTVLLDEVGELPLETQVKLLRFVQDRELAPVGSNRYESVDARVIAATNKDLKEMVERGEFREDLFYRLNVFSISVPPLRDRVDDILEIARHYLEVFAARYKKRVIGFTEEAEQALLRYSWPGNIRELSNVVNRAVILSKDTQVSSIQLGLLASEIERPPEPVTDDWRGLVKNIVRVATHSSEPLPVGRYLEEDFILSSINRQGGVLNRAALTIGVPESTLRRRVQKLEEAYGVGDPDRPEFWPDTSPLYDDVMRIAANRKVAPLEMLSAMLLEELSTLGLSKAVCAQILGVSMTTYRKISEDFANFF